MDNKNINNGLCMTRLIYMFCFVMVLGCSLVVTITGCSPSGPKPSDSRQVIGKKMKVVVGGQSYVVIVAKLVSGEFRLGGSEPTLPIGVREAIMLVLTVDLGKSLYGSNPYSQSFTYGSAGSSFTISNS